MTLRITNVSRLDRALRRARKKKKNKYGNCKLDDIAFLKEKHQDKRRDSSIRKRRIQKELLLEAE